MRATFLWCCVIATPSNAMPTQQLCLLSYDFPPYVSIATDGKPEGAAVEIVHEVFKRIDATPHLRGYPLARSLAMVKNGYADGIFTVKKNSERTDKYVFSEKPLFMQETVLFVRNDSPIEFKGNLQVLAGSAVGLVRGAFYGTVFDHAAAKGTFARLEFVSRDESNFRKLLAGRIDAVVSGRQTGMTTLRRLGIANKIRIAGRPLEITGSYLMFRKEVVDAEFMRRLNTAMAQMRDDGSVQRILVRYGIMHPYEWR